MRRAERVVFAFRTLGEARQPAALAQGLDPVPATGQDLVGIGLVAHVPDQAVARGVVDIVQGDGQLDHAQAGAQVPAGDRHGVQRGGAKFVRRLPQLIARQLSQVGRQLDPV